MRAERVVVVGAGIGGLVAALLLAARGLDVTVCEAAARPGGKLRVVETGGARIDSGPTVLTMRHIFDGIFEAAGSSFAEAVTLAPLDILARHAWTGGATLDLFSDTERSTEAIGAFAGARDAQGFRAFSARAKGIYETLERTFILGSRPSVADLVFRVGPRQLGRLAGISPFTTLSRALEDHFADPRLRQLFGRYATYCGASPYLAPATLMLVAHVESQGVWTVAGGMHRIAEAVADLAAAKGATLRYETPVAEILVDGRRTTGVRLGTGERIEADAVVSAADVGALAAGLLGDRAARATDRIRSEECSLSAVTLSLTAECAGLPLAHHTVFFSDDYPAEFDAIRRGRLPGDPTVYVCAQARGASAEARGASAEVGDSEGAPSGGPEPLFFIANAPPNGDRHRYEPQEIAACERAMMQRLARCGAAVRPRPGSVVATTPSDFAAMFPGTGGALYGRASHGWNASFQRPGSRSRIPGLYLAGGSTHPGPGVPMAAISGRLAAEALISDLASTSRSRPAATRGGTSTG